MSSSACSSSGPEPLSFTAPDFATDSNVFVYIWSFRKPDVVLMKAVPQSESVQVDVGCSVGSSNAVQSKTVHVALHDMSLNLIQHDTRATILRPDFEVPRSFFKYSQL